MGLSLYIAVRGVSAPRTILEAVFHHSFKLAPLALADAAEPHILYVECKHALNSRTIELNKNLPPQLELLSFAQ